MIWLHAALAGFSASLGVVVALQHPLSPLFLTVFFIIWCLAVFKYPSIWLLILPALLPVSSFGAWTGWISVEEFDLLVLGAATGSLANRACSQMITVRQRPGDGVLAGPKSFPWIKFWIGLMALSYSLALARGLHDALGDASGWQQTYTGPLNSLRVAKSFFFNLLLLPSLNSLLRNTPVRVGRYLALGAVIGTGLLSVAIAWERAAFPGFFDFSTPYRTTGLFWEMHVGGAALDFFLVLSVPFVVYTVVNATDRIRWFFAALLAVLATYVCLTSFSRALYLGVVLSLCILGGLLATSEGTRAPVGQSWRRWQGGVLVGVLCIEVLAVIGIGNYMSRRLSESGHDFGGRLQHWRQGLALLRTPIELAFGRGLGRFPANYALATPNHAFPGHLLSITQGNDKFLRIFSADNQDDNVRGKFEVLQRLPLPVDKNYFVGMDLRANDIAAMSIGICRRHLLYTASCPETVWIDYRGRGDWQHVSFSVRSTNASSRDEWWSPLGFFVLRLNGGGAAFVDIDNVYVEDREGRQMLRNGDFSNGLAYWFFSSRNYFIPWHIDNLVVEVLIDQGGVGLLILLVLICLACNNLLRGEGCAHPLAPYLLAALSGTAIVGTFASLLDMPRSAFLFFLLLFTSLFANSREDLGNRVIHMN